MNLYSRFTLLLLCCFSLTLSAETAENFRYYYRVYFTYKTTDTYSLQHPESYLSQTALERRAYRGIAIDSTDLPVSSTFLNAVKEALPGSKIRVTSRWLNSAVVESSLSGVADSLLKLPFVSDVRLVFKEMIVVSTGTLPAKEMEEDGEEIQESTITTRSLSENDYGYSLESITMVNGLQLHEAGFRGKGMQIALLDAGFLGADKLQAFDSTRIITTKNFCNPDSTIYTIIDHGTRCLSIIGSNQPGRMIGTAPDADYYLIVTESYPYEVPMEEDLWVAGAEFGDSLGVDIISSSLGYGAFESGYSESRDGSILDGKTTFCSKGAAMAVKKGILVVNCCGNEAQNAWKTILAPSDVDGVLAVGAVNRDSVAGSFTSYGPSADGRVKPEVAALGVSSYAINQYDTMIKTDGTSFSTPLIAGMAACLWQALPKLTNKELIQLICDYASLREQPDNRLGYGMPNMFRSYLSGSGLSSTPEVNKATTSRFYLTGNHLTVIAEETESRITIYNVFGEVQADERVSGNMYQVETDQWPTGVYLLKIENGVTVNTHKLMIQ